jgi:hypothetical protein
MQQERKDLSCAPATLFFAAIFSARAAPQAVCFKLACRRTAYCALPAAPSRVIGES